jgi:anti-sigma factor RsiW
MLCDDHGLLRAYLDDALPPQQRSKVAAHLADCSSCRNGLVTLRASAAQVATLLGPPASMPDPAVAFERLKSRIDTQSPHTLRKNTMQTRSWPRTRRSWLAAVGAAMAIISLLVFPPVQAAADQLLQVFRVRSVVFFPVDPARIQQLQQLDVDMPALFASAPTVINEPAPPREVSSTGEASQAVGFPVHEPADLPGAASETTIQVIDRTAFSFQVNVDAMRQVLASTGIEDVTLPDELGEEQITVDVAAWASQRYDGSDWEIELYQGRSPDVTLPDGVDLAALGRTGLRVLGMSETEADTVSRQIDWTSTLVVPIPPDIQDVRSVTINNSEGLLVGSAEQAGRHWMLYWQNDDRFYILQAEGAITDQQVIAAARSMR